MSGVGKRRVYHFLKADHGIQNIEKRRIKISTLLGLNDPFELLAHNITNKSRRDLLTLTKEHFDKEFGVLCFSKSSHSPVQWAHYGERHTGVCLGFDVDDDLLEDVCYEDKRTDDFFLPVEPESELQWRRKLLYTKYSHWSYEEEVRTFASLNYKDGDLYFKSFDEKIRLAEVQVGFNSCLTRSRVAEALGDLVGSVEVFKVRPAFQSFKMVRNLDESLWK